jgi:hypothetical protein
MRLDIGNTSGKDWRFPSKLSKRGAGIPKHPQAENCPNKCYKALDDCVIRMDFDKTSDKVATHAHGIAC